MVTFMYRMRRATTLKSVLYNVTITVVALCVFPLHTYADISNFNQTEGTFTLGTEDAWGFNFDESGDACTSLATDFEDIAFHGEGSDVIIFSSGSMPIAGYYEQGPYSITTDNGWLVADGWKFSRQYFIGGLGEPFAGCDAFYADEFNVIAPILPTTTTVELMSTAIAISISSIALFFMSVLLTIWIFKILQ